MSASNETHRARVECSAVGQHAARKLWCAVRRGQLPDLRGAPCADCGSVAKQHEHRDYDKWWEVQPVCVACNVKRGRAAPYRFLDHGAYTGLHIPYVNQFAASMLEATTEPFE